MPQQTIRGACHCGKVQIEADLDLGAGSGRCNCSICSKLRAWTCIVKPQAVRLIAGEDDLSSYEDLEPAALEQIPVRYFDGLHNSWLSTPQYTGYL